MNKFKIHIEKYSSFIILSIILSFVIFVRLRLLNTPLERDEGEYAYFGQLMLQGIPPYKIAYNMKFPGIYLAYAIIMCLFGETAFGIHFGLLIVNCLSIILLFKLTRQLINDFAAVIASAAFAVLSCGWPIYGFAAHATHFIVLFALAGFLLLFKAFRDNRYSTYFLSGLLFGLAYMIKQPGIFFFICGLFMIIYAGKKALKSLSFILGGILPLLLTVSALVYYGVFDRFIFWVIHYGAEYAGIMPICQIPAIFMDRFQYVIADSHALWFCGIVGVPVLLFSKLFRDKRGMLLLFIVLSFLSVCPGFYFRRHYFVAFLPALSVLISIAFTGLHAYMMKKTPNGAARFLSGALFASLLLFTIVSQKEYFFRETPSGIVRTIYGANPFIEAPRIAEFIKANSSKEDKVFVFGSEPEIFFYSQRHSATGYIYVYPLTENQRYSLAMQKEMVSEVESAKPEFVVDVNVSTSWLRFRSPEKYLFKWFNKYISGHYSQVGVCDIISPELTIYKWNEEAVSYKPRSVFFVRIFRRVK